MKNIVFESAHFYVALYVDVFGETYYRVHKRSGVSSSYWPTKTTLEDAKEFIRKAEKYPDNF